MVDVSVIGSSVGPAEASRSAVSWSAVIAGSLTAAATGLILLILGAGLGLTTVSPWSSAGASATTLVVGAAIWLIVTQWLSAGIGGYLTGRLRTKWVSLHTHEVFFRDTAHGFLSWALATVLTVALLGSAVAGIVSMATGSAATVVSGAAQGATQAAATNGSPTDYFVDSLFRSDKTVAAANPGDARAESGRILVQGLLAGDLSAPDKAYLAQLVAAQTGLSPGDAEKRVNDVLTAEQAAVEKAKQAADAARKTAATIALFSFLSLLIGAFIASAAAAFGGRERDELEIVYAAMPATLVRPGRP